MSFSIIWYSIKGWDGKRHVMTAKSLYERIMDESEKSDYDWITSATELVRVCNEPDFPKQYAQGIKIAILNCFANFEFRRCTPSRGEATDTDAVYSCYNSLTGVEEKVMAAKTNYLFAIIRAIGYYHFGILSSHHHVGQAYSIIREDWIKEKLGENISKREIDFEQLKKDLHDDFDKTIKTAEEEGAFKRDDEEFEEEQKRFWSSLNLKDI